MSFFNIYNVDLKILCQLIDSDLIIKKQRIMDNT